MRRLFTIPILLATLFLFGCSSGGGSSSTSDIPNGIWTDGTRLVVLDRDNNRVLIWNTFPTSNNQAADLVLGQPDFTSNSRNQGLTAPTAGTLSDPSYGVYVNGDQLFVAYNSNSRVLIWNSWPTANGQDTDVVLGQPDFTTVNSGPTQSTLSGPTGIFLNGTQLIVGDSKDSRYLIFDGYY